MKLETTVFGVECEGVMISSDRIRIDFDSQLNRAAVGIDGSYLGNILSRTVATVTVFWYRDLISVEFGEDK